MLYHFIIKLRICLFCFYTKEWP
uniref:Uncharacterized protein n=1 Tax=Arundo donax TaxID=35708 RepID=A0A0A9A3Z4_ARUDO